jgi:hypothetical protein
MKNREIANRISELHYPNEPNVIHDQKYRLVRMKTLADQVEGELNLLNIPVVSQRSELLNFMEHLSMYHNIDEVIDCTKYQQIIEQYKI